MALRTSVSHFRRLTTANSCRNFSSAQAYPLDEEFPGVPLSQNTSHPAVESVQLTTLKNGVKVVSRDLHGLSSSLLLHVGVGTRDEDETTSGVCHVLSRMAFQSTKNRSSLRIMRDIEDAGAKVNVDHHRESIHYTADCLRTKIDTVFDALMETATLPAFKSWEISERSLVSGTVNCEVAADGKTMVNEALHAAAYYDSETLGQSLYSNKQSTYTPELLRDFVDSHFVPKNLVVSAVNVNHSELVRLAEESLGNLQPCDASKQIPAEYVGGEERKISSSGEKYVGIALKAPSKKSKDSATAAVFAEALGHGSHVTSRSVGRIGGFSSSIFGRLFSSEKKPTSFSSASSSLKMYNDSGLLTVTAKGVTGETPDACFQQLTEEIRKSVNCGADEITAAKGRLKSQILSKIDSNSKYAELLATQVSLKGKATGLSGEVADIEAVQPADVKRVATEMLKSSPSFACVGELSKSRYNKLVKLFQ